MESPKSPNSEVTAPAKPPELAVSPAPSVAVVFAAALEAPAEARETLVATQCVGDETLRKRILRLLDARDRAGDFLESALPETEAFAAERERRRAAEGKRPMAAENADSITHP